MPNGYKHKPVDSLKGKRIVKVELVSGQRGAMYHRFWYTAKLYFDVAVHQIYDEKGMMFKEDC